MPQEAISYPAILADMKAKRSALDSSISALEAALASGALGQSVESTAVTGETNTGAGSAPVDLPTGAFLGKSVPVAIKLYLEATRRKQPPQEIAKGIQALGVESTSGNFPMIVGTALRRLRDSGDVYQFKDGWGLSSWVPAALRKSLDSAVQATPKKKKKAKAKKTNSTKKAEPAKKADPAKAPDIPVTPKADAGKPDAERPRESMATRIMILLAANPEGFSGKELGHALGEKSHIIAMVCSTLIRHKKIEKTEAGKYRLAQPQAMPKAS